MAKDSFCYNDYFATAGNVLGRSVGGQISHRVGHHRAGGLCKLQIVSGARFCPFYAGGST